MKRQLTFIFSFLLILSLHAQTEQDSTQFDQVRSILRFYEYMLNSIGSNRTSTRDKEVIITESYLKVFESNNVQIEDDLLDNRKVITNKDVDAYLRDVDFFFKDIQFDFTVEKIEQFNNEDSSGYYVVSFESTLEGVTIDDGAFQRSNKRYMEINYDAKSEDLKIASIYSTKVSREKELENWWGDLSLGWKTIFKEYIPFDSISNKILAEIAAIDSLNLESKSLLQDLEPIVALKNLRVLNISNTQIDDLDPIRYARNFQKLTAQNCLIQNIESLKYFDQLTYLNISGSNVIDISVIKELANISYLNLSKTNIQSFDPINKTSKLNEVDLSNTSFSDLTLLTNNENLKSINIDKTPVSLLNPLKSLTSIEKIDASETDITDLSGLSNHPSLINLSLNRTEVSDLSPLMESPSLLKVYADYTRVSEGDAAEFMKKRPDVLIVTNSEKIRLWWETLPANWKSYFIREIGSNIPSRDQLIKLLNRDSLNISGKNFYELAPLKKFKNIKFLDVSNNLFTTFEFTEEMADLKTLIGDRLPIESTLGLEKNSNLEEIQLSETLLKDISSLNHLQKLRLLQIPKTDIKTNEIVDLLNANKDLTIIYQPQELKNWWSNLDATWKEAFDLQNPDIIQLHKLIEQDEVTITGKSITSLEPLSVFINLKKIVLDDIRITNFTHLDKHQYLRSLTVTNGPLQSLDGIAKFNSLEHLNVKNTAIDNLNGLAGMKSIRSLNCAGTNIKNMKGITDLSNLEVLDVSNTRVWKLQRLYGLQKLKELTCYNTRLRQHTIHDFATAFPDCKIDFY